MGILRSNDYLITTSVGPADRRIIWDGSEPQDLDVPHGWVLEKAGGKLRIRDSSLFPFKAQLDDAIYFDIPEEGGRQLIDLPARKVAPNRPLGVEIVRMRTINPVYMLRHAIAPNYTGGGPKQLMQFYGERYYLVRYRPVPPKRMVSDGDFDIFSYAKTATGYTVTAHRQGLRIKTVSESITIPLGTSRDFDERVFFSATVISGVHWWRFRMVPSPDSMPPVETEDSEDDIREELRFKKSALTFLVMVMILLTTMYTKGLHEKPAPRIIANVEIKQPKIIPPTKEELKPKPPPPEPPPEPKVVEAKPEPPKPEPVPKKQPPKHKIAKKTAKPPKVAKVKPPPTPEPPVKSPEPPPPAPVAKEPPANNGNLAAEQKAAETAAMKQQLLNKLNFLSTSSKRSAADPQNYEQTKEGRFTNTPTVGGDVSKSNALDKIVKDAPGDGRIRTNSSRSVASTVDFGTRKGKGLNDVQGKVSLGELYSANSKLGDSIGDNGGLSISGVGQLTDSEVEKALSKYLQRFQFCYEKALLSDSSLGGKVVVQWTITTSGKGTGPKVLTSQLNNKDLHTCIGKVIKEIPFPMPKGGTVMVKKTFAFSSSTL